MKKANKLDNIPGSDRGEEPKIKLLYLSSAPGAQSQNK